MICKNNFYPFNLFLFSANLCKILICMRIENPHKKKFTKYNFQWDFHWIEFSVFLLNFQFDIHHKKNCQPNKSTWASTPIDWYSATEVETHSFIAFLHRRDGFSFSCFIFLIALSRCVGRENSLFQGLSIHSFWGFWNVSEFVGMFWENSFFFSFLKIAHKLFENFVMNLFKKNYNRFLPFT